MFVCWSISNINKQEQLRICGKLWKMVLEFSVLKRVKMTLIPRKVLPMYALSFATRISCSVSRKWINWS